MSNASRREKEQRTVRRDQLTRIAALMADPIGRGYIYDLLSACHVFQSSFATNALAMAFAEGERNVGLQLTADLIAAAPDNYLLMLKESGNVRHRPDDTADNSRDDGNGGDARDDNLLGPAVE